MKQKHTIARLFVLAWMLLSVSVAADAAKTHTFAVGDKQFLLDGKPFVVKAAEIHYMRIPHEYWEHRIEMCKALGMNTICAYVFWNAHEQQEGLFDFTGQRDLARFVGLCQKHGMWVILRPGPYTCAEWEMGGLPWWLLKNPTVRLRSQDKTFMQPVARFERKVADVLKPYRIENGGNIIMVQVENEFGSYGTDKPYLAELRDTLRAAGWDKTLLFQCDWSSNFHLNGLDDLVWTMNFGTNAKVLEQFKKLRQMRPSAPLMCSEYWSGWFDGWGQKHQTRPWDAMVRGIETMLENSISFSLYMTHGGTSFAQWAGANNKGYAPDCTSYDYDAPIDEQGAPTEKYYRLRELLQRFSDTKLPAVPKAKPVVAIPQMRFSEYCHLLSEQALPAAIASEEVKPMEQYGQGYGSIVYSCSLPQTAAGALLRITDLHDYARVYINGRLVGQLYRGNDGENTLRLPATAKGARLDIFVEAMGRINFSKLIHDRKGITERVELITQADGHQLTYDLRHWDVRLLPVSYASVAAMPFKNGGAKGEGYYRTTFNLKKTGDTYLDMSTWGKGLVWLNGHCLGRFWNVGPQQALYVPGCWLKKGRNEIVVMDIVGPSAPVCQGLTKPIVDQLRRQLMPHDGMKTTARDGRPASKDNAGAANDAAPGAK